MAAVAAAGNALSIASLAYEVTKDLYSYYRTWKDCEKDVAVLREHLLWLHHAFKVSRDIVRQPDPSRSGTELLYSALRACEDAGNELRDILDKIRKTDDPVTAWAKLKAHGRKACYPFRKPTVTAIKANVDACCEELQTAVGLLQLDNATAMQKALEELDSKLVEGLGSIETSLNLLPALKSSVSAVEDQSNSIKADTEVLRMDAERKATEGIGPFFCKADYNMQLNDFYARRQEDTGAWFMESQEYLDWLSGTTSTLVCPGQPGAGKTIMATTVIHDLLLKKDVLSVGIAYVFCNYKRQDEQDTSHLLSALVRQLLRRKGKVPEFVQKMYTEHKDRGTRPGRSDLKEAFVSLLKGFTEVYLVIDALDECIKDVCHEFMSVIQEQQAKGRIRILVTTRPLGHVLNHLPARALLEIRAHDGDVAMFLKAQISKLPKFVRNDSDLREKIIRTIVSAVDGMILLAMLHVEALRDCLNKRLVNEALKALPHGSDTKVYAKVYSDAMDRICNQTSARAALAKEAISWITLAKRPLKSPELRHALAVEIDEDFTDIDADDLHDIEEVLTFCSGLLVEDEQSGTVRLVHYTAQTYFEENWMTWCPNAEATVAMKCLKYLSLEPFSKEKCDTKAKMSAKSTKYESHPLLDYCAKHWHLHVSECLGADDCFTPPLVQDLLLRFLDDQNLVENAWMFMEPIRITSLTWEPFDGTTGFHLIAYIGADKLMRALLKAGRSVNRRDSKGCTPLTLAVCQGHEPMTKLLIDTNEFDIDVKDRWGFTNLSAAAAVGHESIAKLLIDTGRVDVDSMDNLGRSPLSHAAEAGQEAIMRLLVDNDQVNVNSKDRWGHTPLSYAILSDCETAAYPLIETGRADFFSGDWESTPLSCVVFKERENIVKMLIDADDFDIDAKDSQDRTLLSYAAGEGSEAIVKLLLDTNQVDVDSRCLDGLTPLAYAAMDGHESVVNLLIDSGRAKLDSKDLSGATILSHAASSGNNTIVSLLLDTGQFDVNSKDLQGCTAWHYAAGYHHDETAKLLEAASERQRRAAVTDQARSTPL